MNLNFKPIELKDKSVFDGFFTAYQPSVSEMTFTNLFIWAKPRKIEYVVWNSGLIIQAVNKGENYFFPPSGYDNCEVTFKFLKEYGPANGTNKIKLIPEYQKKFAKLSGSRLEVDRDNFDYLYKTKTLSELKGWRLDGKRGFVKKFKENYAWEYREYTSADKDACLNLTRSWAENRRQADPSVMDELAAIETLIENQEKLSVKGGVLFVEGKLAAFSFGEKLNDTTFVVHFEKADPQYTGCYQMINQLFIQHEAEEKYLFVNREQDLGIEGLRKAKLSYHPVRLVKKYLVNLND